MYNYVTKQKHTKEGVLNEKLALKKLLTYMKIVYKILQKIKCFSDPRKSIPLFNIVMPVLVFLMLQYESFRTVFSAPESMSKRLKNCIKGKIPKIDAGRDLLTKMDREENGFHQLKTYYHAKHCYWHEATVVIFNLLIIDFNMRELYLYRRIHIFEGNGISRKSVSQIFCVNCRQRR